MVSQLILYSTNSLLAFRISEKYYNAEHFVYCTPNFRPLTTIYSSYNVPPSSCPYVIYRNFCEEIDNNDLNGQKITANKAGLRHGATVKKKSGIISTREKNEILKIIKIAQLTDFRALLYIIPFDVVKLKCHPVPIQRRASPFSDEFYISNLIRNEFDIIVY